MLLLVLLGQERYLISVIMRGVTPGMPSPYLVPSPLPASPTQSSGRLQSQAEVTDTDPSLMPKNIGALDFM